MIQISAILERICRKSDFLIRWGGEEFLVVSRFTSRKAAPVLAERIRSQVEEHDFDIGEGVILKKTCSIGYSCFPFTERHTRALTWEQVIAVADQGLYAAKYTSRNAWVGIDSNASTPVEKLYPQLHDDLPGCLERDIVDVASSIADTKALVWGQSELHQP